MATFNGTDWDFAAFSGEDGYAYVENWDPFFDDVIAEMDARREDLGTALVATSSTNSVSIGTGSKTLTIGTGKGFAPGMWVVATDAGNAANTMTGQVNSHNPATGALVLSVLAGNTTGSGTPSSWAVAIGGKPGAAPSSFAAGTAAAPGWPVTGDSNTGLAQVGGADTLSLIVGGQELARLAAASLALNPARAPISPAIWLMGPSVGEDYSFQRDPTGTGYLIFNGVQIAASGYSFRVNNGTERLRIPNTGPVELEATKFRGPTTAKQGAIAYAATLTLDFATYQDFAVGDLTGPLTLANPSTYPVGQRGEILLHEDATGGRTVSFGANWIKMGNGNVNTAASKYSIVVYWIAVSGYVHYSIVGGA